MRDGVTSSEAPLRRPEEVLPHRPPFLFLDTVVQLDPGVSAVALWTPPRDAFFFRGHFPGRPTLPGVIMLESLAQLGAYTVLADERWSGRLPLFGGVERARFRRQVGPGETLELRSEVLHVGRLGGRGSGQILRSGEKVCEATVMFVWA
ncbi:MAG: 3-hydroxyacyl-[acyl-carrier-protein] dehydratase FabZ [Acidimicrobiales bacterium]|nr:MAG: 3-hydroxyacyl-[acyl-carrier-protein] dehydratase FabZ [Acidimicrobiales bacterium]